ncbi:8227_t:CDS:1, partial [Acaulospora morrowiae]
FPHKKDEGWWIVFGDDSKNTLLGIKRITLNKVLNVKLDFTCPLEAGEHSLKLYVMSDSYMGCDLEYDIEINVVEGGDDSDDEEEGEEGAQNE